STYHSTPQPFHPTPHLKPYTIPNHYPHHYLTTSHLNYTILHPPSLTDDPPTRKIEPHLYFHKPPSIPPQHLPTLLKELLTS
ncbi:NAD(P)H-binding protein, partial [Staphylococcus epidermidis]|uniref:NAD(P)H-binding protein n=1 Tax=Staphylococcus epidermidis TaxID=1282 RepID=UPI0011A2A2F6